MRQLKSVKHLAILAILLAALDGRAQAQTTTFTYQGRLTVNGGSANGVYDFAFQAFDAPSAGNSVGGLVTVNGVGVSNGLFTVLLDLGAGVFTGPARWLQIAVSPTGAGVYTTLSLRQQLTSVPYSIYATTAGTVTNSGIGNAQLAANSVAGANIQNATITAAKIGSGQVVKSLNGLADAVNLSAGANVSLVTNGNTLSISAPAGGLALPYSGAASSANSIFTLTNTGSGAAAVLWGNVGIGMANPLYPLSVRANVSSRPITWERYVSGAQLGKTWAWEIDGAGTYMRNATDVTLPLAILNTGFVGIGNTSPGSMLAIGSPSLRGTLEVNGATSGFGPRMSLFDNRPSGHSYSIYGGISGTGNLEIYDETDGRVDLTASSSGNIGIGTASPSQRLDVNGAFRATGVATATTGRGTEIDFGGNGDNVGRIFAYDRDAGLFRNLGLGDYGHGKGVFISSSGNVGIGTASPGSSLHIAGNQAYERLVSSATYNGSVLELANTTPQPIDAPPVTLGAINFGDGSATPGQISYLVNQTSHGMYFRVGGTDRMTITGDGTVSVGVLQINGADVAEPFELSTKDLPKGSVVIIDEENPGQLRLSEHAYDNRVAGILSGANGVHPGIRLKQQGFNDHGQEVALSGRVYAQADASYGAIKPGDLLTTSDTPGHCMKAIDSGRVQGAIVGKAMSSLKKGKGMVLVLVSLQ